jgi:2,4-dichlorophenol 6-monooxygenase
MLGLQLGYRYDLDADATAGSADDAQVDDRVRIYVPSSEPGGRLPHGWIRRDGAVCSTLDLIPLDRAVLIAGPEYGPGAADLRVGVDFDDPDRWWSDTVEMPAAGALLVRPDQHIAQRYGASSTAPADRVVNARR